MSNPDSKGSLAIRHKVLWFLPLLASPYKALRGGGWGRPWWVTGHPAQVGEGLMWVGVQGTQHVD